MSIKTWKAEFYSTPIEEAASGTAAVAIQHSLTKWKGLTKENLKKHRVKVVDSCIVGQRYFDHYSAPDSVVLNDETCSLCEKYYRLDDPNGSCSRCPLYKVVGAGCGEIYDDPYSVFVDDGDPAPMIKALSKALKAAKKGKK